MVQIVTIKLRSWLSSSRSHEHKSRYPWKLVRDERLNRSGIRSEMRAAGYPVKSMGTKEELLQKYIRWQRGLLNYDRCTPAELRRFCTERGLTSSQTAAKLHVSGLVRKLYEADDGETFNRFLDLPAELRVHIYELYLEDFGAKKEPLDAPYPMPLAEACSLVRREFLPVYHSLCTFEFDIDHGEGYLSPRKTIMSARSYIWAFIFKGPPSQVAMLRKLRMTAPIECWWDKGLDDRENSLVCGNIDLGTNHKPAELQICSEESCEEAEGEFAAIMPLIRSVMKKTLTTGLVAEKTIQFEQHFHKLSRSEHIRRPDYISTDDCGLHSSSLKALSTSRQKYPGDSN
ncbi:hypothetical protein BST61_g3814 [Cercospora zeina]